MDYTISNVVDCRSCFVQTSRANYFLMFGAMTVMLIAVVWIVELLIGAVVSLIKKPRCVH